MTALPGPRVKAGLFHSAELCSRGQLQAKLGHTSSELSTVFQGVLVRRTHARHAVMSRGVQGIPHG